MKNITLGKVFGTAALLSAFIAIPAFALETNTSSSVIITDNGVQVSNAQVTSISGNLISAVSQFKNMVTNWVFTANASTTVSGKATSTAGIMVGDYINVFGSMSSFGQTMNVTASRIINATAHGVATKGYTGTVTSINTSNGTFVLTSGIKTVTVQTSTTTLFKISGATSTTLANLPLNGKVSVKGSFNSNNTVLTATQITTGSEKEGKEGKENKGESRDLKNSQKEMEDRDNEGEHKGFLKLHLKSFNEFFKNH